MVLGMLLCRHAPTRPNNAFKPAWIERCFERVVCNLLSSILHDGCGTTTVDEDSPKAEGWHSMGSAGSSLGVTGQLEEKTP